MIDYLPETLEDLVGLETLKKSLNLLELGSPLMFIGERGSGKTSLSNIVAKKFGASTENIKNVNCGYFRKIDDMRKEVNSLKKSSIFGSKKVLILDEVHSLSKDSQGVWLRELDSDNLLENVLIIACTTTIEKLLPTFLRRFVQYRVAALTVIQSKKLIDRICEKNDITLSQVARTLILKKCLGIPGLILNGVRKLVGISSIEEAQYLLEISNTETTKQLLDLYKIITNGKSSWATVSKSLLSILRVETPESTRVGLMNLIASRFTSSYFTNSEKERKLLSQLYINLQKFSGYPEKANLIFALSQVV